MNTVKEHFDTEAKEFDAIIRRLIPRYEEMLSALVSCMPFKSDDKISVLDLGCGTGAVSLSLLDQFPQSEVTLMDFSPRMLSIAAGRIPEENLKESIESDFEKCDLNKTYDVIVSSLALHHLADNTSKTQFYHRLYGMLNPGGAFANADVVLASSEVVQKIYMAKWKEFMLRSTTEMEIETEWMPRYDAEDFPATLGFHLRSLREAGFSEVDVYWKYFNFAVFGARRLVDSN